MTELSFAQGARCSRHQDSPHFMIFCGTCRRIYNERVIVHKVVTKLLSAGYELQVQDYEDKPKFYKTPKKILDQIFDLDQAVVYARCSTQKSWSWVEFIRGNANGEDVIHDYTLDLSHVLDPIVDWVAGRS